MCKLKRHRMMKWKPTCRSQMGKFWILLLFLSFICMIFHIAEKFQCTSNCRCDLKQKQLASKESKPYKKSFQVQTNPVPAELQSEHTQKSIPQNRLKQLGLKLNSGEKDDTHIIELHRAFKKAELLDASLGSKEKFWQKPTIMGAERAWTIHATKRLRDQNHATKQIFARDQAVVTLIGMTKSIADTKTRTSLIKGTALGTGIIADDHPLGIQDQWINQSQHAAAVTKLQVHDVLKGKRLAEMAAVNPGSKSSQAIEVSFPKRGRTSTGSFSNSSHAHATCKARTYIVFLKMHKSASSTVMNILFRFGEMHNLTFALPINGASQLNYPHYFTATAVEGFSTDEGSQFNIMCHHMRFFQPEIAKVMPSGTLYFTILRNPVHLMESSFAYYKRMSPFAKAGSLEEFLNQTSLFYNATANDSHYAKNLMAFDFGYNHNGNFSIEHIQLIIKAIEAEFNLVLISEYFDESMVLLKEILCWDLDDIASFPLNRRDIITKTQLSEDTIEKLKRWNKLDWELYMHFNKTFWKKIYLYIGKEHLKQEVKVLQQKQEQLAKICLQEGDSVSPKKIRDQALVPLQYGSAKILDYNLRPELDKATRQMCRRMVTPELQYSHFLYRKQFLKKALKFSDPAYLLRLHNYRTNQ
ncbi:galactose-3-O-sulfotransferase 2-like [Liasis olivaceus]